MDLFHQFSFGKTNDYNKFIKYKFAKRSRELAYDKIKLLMSMGLVSGGIYAKCILFKIKLAKELMILDIEQGKEFHLKDDLSQDHLPSSFRYYDSIIRIV